MNEKELWDYLQTLKVHSKWHLDREFVWVTKQDFQSVRKHFVSEFNIFHRGESLRSNGYWRHIHAVDQNEYMFLHQDTGNIARFFPLGLVHLFLDVIPHETYARIRGPRKLYYQPPISDTQK